MTIFYAKSTSGFYDTNVHSFIPEDAVEITLEEHAHLISGQASGKIISADSDGNPILIDPPPATTEQIWQQIKIERDKRKNGGFQVAGKWFHSDAESLTRYLGLVQLGANIPARNWKTMDGSEIPMTQELAAAVFAAAVAHDGAVFDAGEAHKSALMASTEQHAYDFSADWPLVFSDQIQ